MAILMRMSVDYEGRMKADRLSWESQRGRCTSCNEAYYYSGQTQASACRLCLCPHAQSSQKQTLNALMFSPAKTVASSTAS